MVDSIVTSVLAKWERLKEIKKPWMTQYQTIGEYVTYRKQDFTTQHSPGEFLTDKIFDSTAPNANHLMAATMIGALWPSAARSFRLLPHPDLGDDVMKSQAVKDYFQKATNRMQTYMDHPRAGLMTSLEEYMLDQGSFGTSGVSVLENTEDDSNTVPVRYRAIDVKRASIDEGANGFVDTVYRETEYTVKQYVQEFEKDIMAPQVIKYLESGKTGEKIKVLHAIEPRLNADPNSFGSADFPIASIHIDVTNLHVIRNSGFHEMPDFVSRFRKAVGEMYGRSPAFESISDILEINAHTQMYLMAVEKNLDPPIIITDDGSLGGNAIDKSAGTVLIRRISGRMGDAQHKVVEQMVTVGELKSSLDRINTVQEKISNQFYIDRMLDLNNETRMTYGEAQIRNGLRGQSLSTIYARQQAELFTPMIERTYNILFGLDLLGIIPNTQTTNNALLFDPQALIIPQVLVNAMRQGKHIYYVDYISPASRIMQSEQYQGMVQWLATVAPLAAAHPEVYDNVDLDEFVRDMAERGGVPTKLIRSSDAVAKIRTQTNQARQRQQQLLEAAQQAETAKAASQAAFNSAKAGINPAALLGAAA